MRILVAGEALCSSKTFKRLLLIADEIGFMDRPALMFGDWGMIGDQSPVRGWSVPTESPVELTVHSPTALLERRCYERYIEEDLRNPEFVSTFMTGIRSNPSFAGKYLPPTAKYGDGGTGASITNSLAQDTDLDKAQLSLPTGGSGMFRADTAAHRRTTLAVLLCEASAKVTSAMAVSAETGLLPTSDDPFTCRLMALRAVSARYVNRTPRDSGTLALAIAQSVVPDEALDQMSPADILDYRKRGKAAHQRFVGEVDALACKLAESVPAARDDEISRLIAAEILPRLREYRDEMRATRDAFFGALLKKLVRFEVPTLSLCQLVGMDWASALWAFLAGLAPAVPEAVDFFSQKRQAARKCGLSFLVGAAEEVL